MLTREVTWGDAIVLEARRVPGGLLAVVKAINAEVGAGIGTRNTFAKLYDIDEPAQLNKWDSYRAWLLLAALGENPEGWGIMDDVVPSAIDARALKQRLIDWRARRDSNPQPLDP